MRAVRRAYLQSTRVLGVLLCLLGVAMVVTTLARGGGPLALGVVVGVAFALLGAGRVVLAGGLRPPRRGA
jgi:drug/metabolite transporter (DMT)-like permease